MISGWEIWRVIRADVRYGRHRVLDPYRSAFDPKHVRTGHGFQDPPPHRYLFHCYMYQYHLMRFSSILTEIVRVRSCFDYVLR